MRPEWPPRRDELFPPLRIGSIVRSAKTPVVAGEQGLCVGCGIATLSISYYDLGTATGKMAAKVLTGEADISKIREAGYDSPQWSLEDAVADYVRNHLVTGKRLGD